MEFISLRLYGGFTTLKWSGHGVYFYLLVQTDPSEKIDLLTQEAYKGFLTFLSPIRCPLWLTNFSKLFHVS